MDILFFVIYAVAIIVCITVDVRNDRTQRDEADAIRRESADDALTTRGDKC